MARIRRVGTTVEEFESDLLSNLYYRRGTTIESASAQDAYDALALTVRDRLVERRARTAAAHYAGQPAVRLLPVRRVPAGPAAARRTCSTPAPRELLAAGRLRTSASRSTSSTGSTSSRASATAAWAGSPPACWTRWPRWTSRRSATASATTSASSSRRSRTARRSSGPTTGRSTATRGSSRAPTTAQLVGFYGHTERSPATTARPPCAGCRARSCWASPATCWCPATAPRRSTSSGCGGPGPASESLRPDLLRPPASTPRRSRSVVRCGEHQQGPLPGRQHRSSAASCASSSSTSWSSCSLRDIIRRFRFRNSDWDAFADKVVIQLNDTHPVLAIPELMRMLVDEDGRGLGPGLVDHPPHVRLHLPHAAARGAGDLAGRRCCERLLPRHLEIIYEINHRFLRGGARRATPATTTGCGGCRSSRRTAERRVRMAHLAVVGSSAVNGVAELHSRLLAETTLRDFADAVAGEVPQRHQRRHAPPLRAAGQPAAVRADHRAPRRRRLADRPGPAAGPRGRPPTTPRCRRQWRAIKRPTSRTWPRGRPRRWGWSSTPRRCST